jgi:hypothetical protein
MEQIKLDMIPKGITPIAHASQYDQGRLIHFILMDNLQAFILTDETVTIKVCKPDNNIVTAEATYTANTNIVTISTTEQMCAVAGDAKCELSVIKGDVKIGSLNFILRVEEDPLKDGVESETVIANLDTIIDNAVSEALNDTVLYGAYPTAEIDNVPIASFSDGADDVPVKALQIGIDATQEGTGDPSPSNVRNIVGFTGANIYNKGVNLWDEEWESGSISSSTGENTTGTGIRAKNYIPVKEDVIYYPRLNAELQTNATNIQVRFYDANKNYIGSDNYWGKTVLWNSNTTERTLRVPVGARFMRFALQPVYGSTYSDSNRISINYPATDTAYHAYNANSTTTPITWQDEAGTVYGGTLDVTTGNLVVTHNVWITNGTETWIDGGNGNYYTASHYSLDSLSGSHNGKSNYFTYKWNFAQTNGCMAYTNRIQLTNTSFASVEDLQTAFNQIPLVIVYPLATPITVQLTPTQISAIVGTNNVFTDTGDIQNLIYRRDMNSIVEAIPAHPSENGTYSLKCTVSGGVASYSWVAD